MTTIRDWYIFKGDHRPRDQSPDIPPAPPWRQFQTDAQPPQVAAAGRQYWTEMQSAPRRARDQQRGRTFQIREDQQKVIDAVNAALYLRRPLLVTGKPGSGKTSLAYAIAYELNLGPVLLWPITARTTLTDGLYRYDAIARLQDAQLRKQQLDDRWAALLQAQAQGNPAGAASVNPPIAAQTWDPYQNIGDYIQLGALGTAFLPTPYPRVLLIDEIDKSDINLPNDLLNILEEGEFEIPELVRLADRETRLANAAAAMEQQPITIRTEDELSFPLWGGKVCCQSFPLIVMTSNDERDFPAAFRRRCLTVEMPQPTETDLQKIVTAHLGDILNDEISGLIKQFAEEAQTEAAVYATDQLLNMIYMRTKNADVAAMKEILLRALTNS